MRRWHAAACAAMILGTNAAFGITHSTTAHAAAPGLMLPWSAGTKHNINNGYSYGQGDHVGIYRYAIDWNLGAGSVVTAVLNGNAYTGHDTCGGYYVWITHAGALGSYYGHLDGATLGNWIKAQGQTVVQGQQIALSDTSGSSTCISGAHLHFHMLYNASGPFDPNATPYKPEPMTAPNGVTYTGFGAYGSGVLSPDYQSTMGLPHQLHATGSVTWFDTTVTPNVQRVNAFYLGSDGKAYINYLQSGTWYWLAGSSPAGVTLNGGAGVVAWWDTSVTPNAQRVDAFYFGSDGNSYIYYFDAGSGTWAWTGGLRPSPYSIVGGAGTVQYWVATTPAVNTFLLGNDGKAYIEYFDASGWHLTGGVHPSGVSLVSAGGAQQWWDTSQRVNAYLAGNDVNSYKEYFDGTNWALAAGSKPSSATVTQIVGATTWWDDLANSERVYAFAIGNDGNAYRVSYSSLTDSGLWSTGSTPGASLVGGAGAIEWIDTDQEASGFFQGANGSVYRQFYTASSGTWSWDTGIKPASNYLAGGVGAVAYVYNGVQAVNTFLMGTDGAPYIEFLYSTWGLTQEGNLPSSSLLD